MSAGIVPELLHERVLLQGILHDPALDSLAAAVHEPQFAQPLRVRRASSRRGISRSSSRATR
jgi:hypothetical protein